MTQFEDRGAAYENEFSRNEEFDFKVHARRNKLLGRWAATKLGLDPAASDEYILKIIETCFKENGDECIYRKIKGDLEACNLDISEHQLYREMEDQMIIARKEMLQEMKT